MFPGLGWVRMVKNDDLKLENAALGLRPRPQHFQDLGHTFPIRTSQPVNGISNIK